jgi:hypothetical protein
MTASISTASPTVPDSRRSDLILYMAIAFILSWASWFAAIGLGGSAMTAPTVLPYLFGAFGPVIGALVIRIRRARRGEPLPNTRSGSGARPCSGRRCCWYWPRRPCCRARCWRKRGVAPR